VIDAAARLRRGVGVAFDPVEFGPGAADEFADAVPGQADLMYGAGLRVMEALRLRVKDVDFGQRHLLIRDRQGSSFPAGIRRFRAVADRQMASRRNGPRKTTTRVTRS